MLDLPQSQTEGEAYLWLHASDADPVEVKGKKNHQTMSTRGPGKRIIQTYQKADEDKYH